jgi:hypothetical protein
VVWEWLDRWLGRGRIAAGGEARPREPDRIRGLEPADHPWGVPVLDVRPVTLGGLSMTKDRQCALNAMSFAQDDGTGFVGVEPRISREIPVGLRYRIDGMLADGALFIPREMEHKWALYFLRGQIICVRSWLRQVVVVADARIAGEFLEVTALSGAFCSDDEPPAFSIRVLDYLLRSHALDMIYPAPLPAGADREPQRAAMWCMSTFGNRVHFATPHELVGPIPERPLRTHSLLHMAVACGKLDEVKRLLNAGMPADLLAGDGLAPLHWAIAQDDIAMPSLLLERGSPVDVRSAEGATPLMNAAQARSLAKVAYLLDRGADADAADGRGFTALHRAAEMGEIEIVRLLLGRGASPHRDAQGHTPRSLAAHRGEKAIVELMDSL